MKHRSSIRDIEKNRNHSHEASQFSSSPHRNDSEEDFSSVHKVKRSVQRRKNRIIFRLSLFIIIVVAAILFIVTTALGKAEITLELSTIDVSIDGTFTATREITTEDISFRKFGPITEKAQKGIPAVDSVIETERAEGTITVFNTNPSGEGLTLVANTRFQTSDGRIYKTPTAVNIPGGKTVGGKFVSGERDISVRADEDGDGYNITNSNERFTIPGLNKSGPYSDTYALSKTSIIGGFKGERLIADSDTEEEVRFLLQTGIQEQLMSRLRGDIKNFDPVNWIVFDSMISVSFKELKNEQQENSILVGEEGVLYAVGLREDDLAELIARNTISSETGDEYPNSLTIEDIEILIDSIDELDFANDTSISFRVTGNPTLSWDIDEILLFNDIKGQNEAGVRDIIAKNYPQALLKRVDIFPFWVNTIPENRRKVNFAFEYTD